MEPFTTISTTDELMDFVDDLKMQMEFDFRKKARIAVRCAIARGELIRPLQCSSDAPEHNGRIEAHHPDYSRPLDVVWLCSACHHKADRLRRDA